MISVSCTGNKSSALFCDQLCSAISSVLRSVSLCDQPCSAISPVLRSALFCDQPCSAISSVLGSALFCDQALICDQFCSVISSDLRSVLFCDQLVVVGCYCFEFIIEQVSFYFHFSSVASKTNQLHANSLVLEKIVLYCEFERAVWLNDLNT